MTIQRRERIITVLWVLVQCPLYFGLHRKNSFNSHNGFISLEWTIEEIEVGRADGKEGVRVQGENVLVISGVLYDMLREV